MGGLGEDFGNILGHLRHSFEATEWFVRSENVPDIFRARDLKMVFAQNALNECAGVSESDRACQMTPESV